MISSAPTLHRKAPTVDIRIADAAQVVLMGSDIPDVDPAILAAAFQALDSHQLVLGPACDGGFYLIGATAAPQNFLEVCHAAPHVHSFRTCLCSR